MRHSFTQLFCIILSLTLALTIPSSCTKRLEERIDSLESRVEKLETLCSRLDSNIKSIEEYVKAIQSGDKILSVKKNIEGGTVIGYTIVFEKNDPITIYNGLSGENGKDGQNGLTPQFKITNGTWYVSYDGLNWEALGPAKGADGDSFFSKVYESNGVLYIVLNTGEVFSIEISPSLEVILSARDTSYVLPGQSLNIEYTITTEQENNNIQIELITQGDISANLKRSSQKSFGEIEVVIGHEIEKAPAKLLMFISNGKFLVMKSLYFIYDKEVTKTFTASVSGAFFKAPLFDEKDGFGCMIDWGDGTIDNYQKGITHTYQDSDTHIVSFYYQNSDAFSLENICSINILDLSQLL